MHKNLTIKSTFGFLILALLSYSCEEVFDPSMLDNDPRLVVISQFEPDEPVIVRVSQTRSVIDPENISYVQNAEVSIYQDTLLVAELQLMEEPNSGIPSYSSPDFAPVEGVLYTMVVSAPGFTPVSAQSLIPAPIPLNRVKADQVRLDSLSESNNYLLTIEFEDPGSKRNYYHLNLFQEVVVNTDKGSFIKLLRIGFSEDANTADRTVDPEGGFLFDDQEFDGILAQVEVPFQFELELEGQELGETIVELRSVTEEYFLFQSSVSKQNGASFDPLTEPTLLFNNVINGHGVFAGYNPVYKAVLLNF